MATSTDDAFGSKAQEEIAKALDSIDEMNMEDLFAPDCRKMDIQNLVCEVRNDLLKPLDALQERCTDYDDLAGVIIMKSCIIDMHKEILKRLDEVVK